MILVTGAAGKTGRAVLRVLASRGVSARAWVHRADQETAVREAGAQEVVTGDFLARPNLERACKGIRTIYHICPNVSPDEIPIGHPVVEGARRAGVEHFVYHSVLHPQTRAMPHHWRKLQVEEHLLTSGLPFTILQPAAYMQNLRASWSTICHQGKLSMPYASTARIALVDLNDVAEVAARVMTEAGHENATYPLSSGEAPHAEAIAALLTEVLQRPVRAAVQDRRDWEEQARAAGLGEEPRATLLAMFRFYERHGLPGNGNVLRWLLGRPPTTLRSFLERTQQELA